MTIINIIHYSETHDQAVVNLQNEIENKCRDSKVISVSHNITFDEFPTPNGSMHGNWAASAILVLEP